MSVGKMTAIIKTKILETQRKIDEKSKVEGLLINGKRSKNDWNQNQRQFFRFLELIPRILRTKFQEEIVTEAFLHYLRYSKLLLESHISNEYPINDEMLAYFLAILSHHTTCHNRIIEEKSLMKILRYWGIDNNYSMYLERVYQAEKELRKI
ncbi:MAG: hypothetical protein ACTSRO_03815 [Candidatus Heimdallarchaeaceae archaeon]